MKGNLFKRMTSVLLASAMVVSMLAPAFNAHAASQNLALNKPVTVSGVEGGYKENGELTYSYLDPVHLTDGSNSTRWSSDIALTSLDLSENPDQNVWAYVDLGEEVEIGTVKLVWQNANSRNYDIQVSSDAENWEVLKHYEDPDNKGIEYTETLELEEPVTGRYVRIYARLGTVIASMNLTCPTISLYEMEVYRFSNEATLETVLGQALEQDITANEDYTKLNLPTVPEGYEIGLYATSNAAVADTEGNIIRPLEDVSVNLFYEIKRGEEVYRADEPKQVVIEGLYEESETINEKPAVVPEIREWKGNEGTVAFNDTIVIESEELRETAEQIAMYFKEMSDIDAEIITGTPQNGNIYLELDENSVLGDEGYEMEIADAVTVTAKTAEGILYGGTTISQMLSMAEDHHSLPKGLMRDYPQYEVRAVMLDVARQYIPLEYLTEMTRYAGYFKLSEFRNHINDNGGEQSSAFRVESKVYPQLNDGLAPENVYSQEDYKAYQKDAKKYGVDVVTEIDTPAHAGAIGKIDSSLLMDGYHLDLRTEEAYQRAVSVMKEIFDEFLDGEDPVFQNQKFHIGTDEYDKSYSEVLRRYMDELIKYVNAKGFESRFWASLGTNGFAGTTPVSTDVIAHMWSHSWASFEEMKEDGYKFINNADGILYIVPWAGYNNYLNIKNLYNNWEYSNLNGGKYLAEGHPQLLGAEAALWYDIKVGASEFDIFDRFRDQIIIMAEKGWYGEKDDETGDEFIQRVEALGKETPKANPARFVESAGSLVASYDFDSVENNTAQDGSGNGYDASLNGLYTTDGALRLNGEGYLSLPFDSLGYPYTVKFDLTIDKATPSNALIFEGKDGKFFYDYDGTGKIGYERKGYSYVIDANIPVGVSSQITITGDDTNTTLYINGMEVGHGKYYQVTGASKESSNTFVLPTEKIGSGIYGMLDNLKLYNYTMSSAEAAGSEAVAESGNIALNKPVSVSGVEGGYEDDGVTLVYPQFDPKHATDGDTTTRISLNRDDNAWVMVDLGKPYLLEKTVIKFREMPNAYSIMVSEDGEEWTTVDERRNLNGGSNSEDLLEFERIVKARYVKYQQLEQFVFAGNGSKYSGNFSEFEVYGYEVDKYVNSIEDAREGIAQYEMTDENRAFIELVNINIAKLESMLETGPISEMELLNGTISQQLKMLESGNIPKDLADKAELEALLQDVLSEDAYSAESWNRYQQAYNFGKTIYYNAEAEQSTVDYACQMIRDAKAGLGMKNYVTITAKKNVYQDYVLSRLIDGDTSSLTWLEGNQTAGDYIMFTFRDKLSLTSMDIYSVNAGADILHHGKAEVSVDGKEWKTLALIGEKEVENLTFDAIDAKYVRISVTEDASYWWKITEVVFNGGTIQDKEVLKQELSVNVDQNLYTEESYAAYAEALAAANAVNDDSEAVQSAIDAAAENLRNARNQLVKILDKRELKTLLDNKEEEALYTEASYEAYKEAYHNGTLLFEDEEAGQNEIDAAVWKILEAKRFLLFADADYTAVNDALAAAEALVKENYKDFSGVDAAVEAVVEGLDITKQSEVDEMAKAITDAIEALEYKDADYTSVNAAKETAATLVKENYKDFSGVEAAIEAVAEGLDITKQSEVDAMAKAITDAIAALEYKEADYTKVNEAIEEANALIKTNYKDFSAVEQAIAEAVTGKDITEQEAVDAMAKAIRDAVKALELREANYTAVNEAKEAAEALVKENYKDFSAVEAALAAVTEGLDITKQSEVDAYAKAIKDAIAALEYKDADYTAVNEAKAEAQALERELYKSFAAVDKALSDVKEGLDITKQGKVDAYAKAIKDAIAALEYKDADYTAVYEAIAKAEALVREDYKDFTAVDMALSLVREGLDITKQSEVDAYAKAIEDAIAALEYKDADYTAVNEAIAKAEALVREDYKDFTAVDMALSLVREGLDITKQSEVDAYAKAIEDAIAGLEKKPENKPVQQPEEPDATVPTTPITPTAPATGDTAMTMIYIMAMAAATAVISFLKKRKHV